MVYKNLKSLLIVLLLAGINLAGFAQRTITGVVFDHEGNTLPGATVVVEGTTIGATTDLNGEFSLDIPEDKQFIEVSFVGFLSESISVEDTDYVEVELFPTLEQLQEVVVTALGIKRDQKALGYAVESVDADDFQNMSRINPINALAGQMSGLQVSASGSGPGGSTKVLVRGVNSLTGSNEPLYVIDGVPVDNTGGVAGGQFGGFDYGSAINNINMDDIESISVLKGGAASALYGSRGQNGVIMITTRSGFQEEGIGISYQTSFSVDDPLITPEFQNQFSQGSSRQFDRTATRSWGDKMTGQEVVNFLNQDQVLTTNTQDPYSFFRRGTNFDQSVTLNKRGESNSIYFSASWNQNDGIMPHNAFDRKSFNLRYDSELSDFISFDARANYINQQVENRPNLAGSPDNPIYLFASMPRSIELEQLETFRTVDGYPVVWNSRYDVNPDGSIRWHQEPPAFAQSPLLQNPYWATELNTNQDTRNRLMGFGEINFDFSTWFDLDFDLDLQLKAGIDYYQDRRERITATNTHYVLDGNARGEFYRCEVMEQNYDLLITYGNQWGDFSTVASVGGNIMNRSTRSLSSQSTAGLINEVGPYVIQNFNNPITNQGISDMEIHSLYGLVSTDWRRAIFLDLTLRNDWTSVLAPDNWSYLYPSISSSILLEEFFEMPQYVDMLKLRGSWAGVGSGGSFASQRYFQYGTNPGQYLGLAYGSIPTFRPEYNLKSEFTISQEVGIESILFGNRFNLDISYYQTGTEDQIFRAPMAPSSGFNTGVVNAGYIKNSGIELQTNLRIIENDQWRWSAGFNFTRQWSNVDELGDEIDILNLGGIDEGVYIAAQYNQPVGLIMGSAFARDDNGNILLDSERLPIVQRTEDGAIDYEQNIGNSYPDILAGFNTNIAYQRFVLGIQVDAKLGHDIFSLTNLRGAQHGTFGFTSEGRDEWQRAVELAAAGDNLSPQDFDRGFEVEGVKDGEKGTYYVNPQRYWDRVADIHEAFLYDASYIRLRQINLGFNLDPAWLGNLNVREMSVSVFANNVLYLMKKTDNISPESSFGTGNAVGIEMYAYPEMRNIGASLRVSF